ncbi:PLP-dependent transferase [Thermostichus vulcanus]|uniref:PLP-dependent transferase n=1 Tax=Thermostichus vulcanus str. 'Rupite' TaxID=2813851 RepID=A0ABT0C9M7_THEVL|nr:PLP-dependent transferase [Thermostichus vulcanus]MCJ2542493.1 PLP-dependent transferase [Thermostichus vulcanus str. 'Rupite']
MHFETLAIHAGRHLDPSTGAVIPPIHLSTTFWRDPLRTLAGASLPDYTYTRESNPTRVALEEALARLEGGSAAALFASGSAATLAVLQTLSSGDQVLLPQDVYYGTFKSALKGRDLWVCLGWIPLEIAATGSRFWSTIGSYDKTHPQLQLQHCPPHSLAQPTGSLSPGDSGDC